MKKTINLPIRSKKYAHRFIVVIVFTLISLPQSFSQPKEKLQLELGKAKMIARLKPDSAYLQLRHITESTETSNKTEIVAEALQEMGKIAYHLGSYPQALADYLESYQLYKTFNNQKKQAELLSDIGILYYYNRQPIKAFESYRKALGIYKSIQYAEGIANTYGKLGHLYEKQAHNMTAH
ncbi:tetratricopeptide repeat protein [Sphingobacterium gobiense]|uniref:Uncharacterized protein n=1 Tax=Sphingobacterium gobiense TaxID=1382456 RepID=A0A2S9JMG0_9SPHI|nr:tetratricopeptide repeat protein [Sphingobacterium gobiense]PRD54324.1 hypothetical protein C5749_12715 [Sphingobacterium gobiense]